MSTGSRCAEDRGLVQVGQARVGAGLAQHAGVLHAGQDKIMQIGRSEQLGRKVEAVGRPADQAVAVGRLPPRLAGGRLRQVHVRPQVPEVEASGFALEKKLTVADVDVDRLALQTLGGGLDEQGPRLGAGGADRSARGLGAHAADGQALVRGSVGMRLDHVDPVHGHVEFLGGDLGQAGQGALAVFDLADGDADNAGSLEADPAVEPGIGGEVGGDHAAASRIRLAARATAAMMRLCAPHRQRRPDSAAAISARLGSGFLSMRALAATTIPARQ